MDLLYSGVTITETQKIKQLKIVVKMIAQENQVSKANKEWEVLKILAVYCCLIP